MREVAFIKQNLEKWKEVENLVYKRVKKNPDDLSSIYINLINDLSFSQTYYPKSKTTAYLNFLASEVFQMIYKTRRTEKSRIISFFKTETPLLMYRYRNYLVYSFSLFLLFTIIGAFSAHYDEEFTNLILGDEYVYMTIENIKKGNEVGVYQDENALIMTFMIIINNLKVGAYHFVSGVFIGLGTAVVLMHNAIMLGAFQYLFFQYGDVSTLANSAKGIWIHGVFEIFAMIIEAAAGLILGASVLFPKTYSRFNAFKLGAKDAIKIFLSTVPFTIVAGIFESFVTRHALVMPLWLDMLIIFGSLAIVIFYYCIYPHFVYKTLKKDDTIL
ncbi:MAG: stage II sporulation protein M [Bergeyella cardium]